jgi:hypothetical protein
VDRITADLPFKEDERPAIPPYYTSVELHEKDYTNASNLPVQILIRDEMPKTAEKIYIHADHGISASPTTIYISFFDAKEGARCWRQFMRVLLFDMQTQSQVDVFHYLAETLERMFKIKPVIGLDTTGQGGQAVMSFLEAMGHPVYWAYLSTNVDFGTRMESDEEYIARMKKNPMDNPERLTVMQQSPLKQIAIPVLKRLLYAGELRLVNQGELWKQIEGTTDTQIINSQDRKYETDYNGPNGDQPDYNHDLQAFEVFAAMIHRDIMAPEIEMYHEMWSEEFETPWGRFDR